MLRFLTPLAPLAVLILSCGFIALPIEKAANSSRTDAQAADGKGGWLDLGSHDLSVLPAGEARYSTVGFIVPPAGDENAKNCIVIGRTGPEKAVLKLDKPATDKYLYLLHAIAEGPVLSGSPTIGTLVLRYEDGATSECPVDAGRDVTDWTSGRSFKNAVRAWTEYNNNTQVSLAVARFKLKEKKNLAEVTFSANGKRPWMIVAATLSGEKKLVPVRSSVAPTGTYKSPDPPPADLARMPGRKPKNIILIIGDGMGQGAARLASYYKHGQEDGLYFQKLPVMGLCSTFSASAPITDSAASGTAFSTGTKTSNGVLGLQVDGQHDRKNPGMLTSVAARAHAQGRGVAILTSDPLYGATPSAFFAHVLSRGESEKICEQASECDYDVLIGTASTEAMFRPESQGGKRKDGRDLVAEMQKRGYQLVHTPEEMAAASREAKILGSFTTIGDHDSATEESIGEAMAQALTRVGNNPNGFFMMAECGVTDHACHANNASKAVKAVSMVEFMTKVAIDFACARGDTLVVVTADHDTGHPMVVSEVNGNKRSRVQEIKGSRGNSSTLQPLSPSTSMFIQWSTTSHSPFPVPVYAYGPGAELFEGLIDNTDIAKNIARLMDLGK